MQNDLMAAVTQVAGKELSPHQVGHIRSHAMRITTSDTLSVQQGTYTEEKVPQPVGFVNFLKRHKALPRCVTVKRISHVDRPWLVRSALFGINYSELYDRKENIIYTLDCKDLKGQFDALDSHGYFKVLEQMVALASSDAEHRQANDDGLCELVDLALQDTVISTALRRREKVAPMLLSEKLIELQKSDSIAVLETPTETDQ